LGCRRETALPRNLGGGGEKREPATNSKSHACAVKPPERGSRDVNWPEKKRGRKKREGGGGQKRKKQIISNLMTRKKTGGKNGKD